MRRKCRGLIDLDKIAVRYNNRLRGRTGMVLPGSCPHSMVVTIGNCRHKVKYVLKKDILWKQRLHQRNVTRVCIFPGLD